MSYLSYPKFYLLCLLLLRTVDLTLTVIINFPLPYNDALHISKPCIETMILLKLTSDGSTTATLPLPKCEANLLAIEHPAVPPPTTTTR